MTKITILDADDGIERRNESDLSWIKLIISKWIIVMIWNQRNQLTFFVVFFRLLLSFLLLCSSSSFSRTSIQCLSLSSSNIYNYIFWTRETNQTKKLLLASSKTQSSFHSYTSECRMHLNVSRKVTCVFPNGHICCPPKHPVMWSSAKTDGRIRIFILLYQKRQT